MDGLMDGWTDRWVDRWMDGLIDGWTDVDGWTNKADDHYILYYRKAPSEIPWKDNNVDVVVESTGIFTTLEKAKVSNYKLIIDN